MEKSWTSFFSFLSCDILRGRSPASKRVYWGHSNCTKTGHAKTAENEKRFAIQTAAFTCTIRGRVNWSLLRENVCDCKTLSGPGQNSRLILITPLCFFFLFAQIRQSFLRVRRDILQLNQCSLESDRPVYYRAQDSFDGGNHGKIHLYHCYHLQRCLSLAEWLLRIYMCLLFLKTWIWWHFVYPDVREV